MAVLGCSLALPIFHVPGITWEPCPSADSAGAGLDRAPRGVPGLGAARATHQGLRCEGRGPAAWCLEAVAPERPESPPKGHAGKDEAT